VKSVTNVTEVEVVQAAIAKNVCLPGNLTENRAPHTERFPTHRVLLVPGNSSPEKSDRAA
jgi:hypothetical protein